MTGDEKSFICPECGQDYDPMHQFCIQCGADLPDVNSVRRSSSHKPQGADIGVEPAPDELHNEPLYRGGGAAGYVTPDDRPSELQKYSGEDPGETDTEVPLIEKSKLESQPASGCVLGLMIVMSLAIPPVGIFTMIAWAFMKPYRKAILPAFLATIVGILLWGWMIWGGMRSEILVEPYDVLETYLVAQAEANVGAGHYMSLPELKRHGYLKADFPGETESEFEIIEHVLGPTGFIVEIRPGDEEVKFFKIQSLWADHTADIRLGSRDGPRYEP